MSKVVESMGSHSLNPPPTTKSSRWLSVAPENLWLMKLSSINTAHRLAGVEIPIPDVDKKE